MPESDLRAPRDSVLAGGERPAAPARSWLRPILGALSPAGRRGRLTILIFHRVHPSADPLFPNELHASSFRERMQWIAAWFNVLPLDEAVAALARGSLPERALAITFDDGYANNCAVAMPILRRLGLHATFFVATGFLDGGRMWNDTLIEAIRRAPGPYLDLAVLGLGRHRVDSADARRHTIMAILYRLRYLSPQERDDGVEAIAATTHSALPRDMMMTREQVRELAAAGMGIGGHTVSHPILARIDDAIARQEMADGRDELQAIIRQPVKIFAYPNGKPGTDYTATHVRMARELGFGAALSTARGAASADDSVHELPRFTPWERTPAAWGWRLLRNLRTPVQRVAP